MAKLFFKFYYVYLPQRTFNTLFLNKHILMVTFFRFLKSDLYKDSLLADMGGTPLPINGQDQTDPQLAVDLNVPLNLSTDGGGGNNSTGKAGKGGKDEGSRRKSILPWGRNRSKSKDRAEQERISLFKVSYTGTQSTLSYLLAQKLWVFLYINCLGPNFLINYLFFF